MTCFYQINFNSHDPIFQKKYYLCKLILLYEKVFGDIFSYINNYFAVHILRAELPLQEHRKQ